MFDFFQNEITVPLYIIIGLASIHCLLMGFLVHRIFLRKQSLVDQEKRDKLDIFTRISHEIRNPMNGIIGIINLLLNSPLNEKQRHELKHLQFCSQYLKGLLNSILVHATLEKKALEITPKAFSLRSVIENITVIYSTQAKDKGLVLNVSIPKQFPDLIYGDEVHLQEIIVNLVHNAITYTPSGKIVINLTFDIIKDSNVHFKLNITDTGIGIEKEKENIIFEKFTRIRDNKDLTNSGLGLGLSISRHLISLMNGSINLNSTLGKGSCFTIELTLPIVNNSATSTTNRLQFMTPIFSAKVLVAEDYLYNLIVIKELLEKFGCTVETCSDGITALQMMKENQYNIVFLDIDLPGMNGIDVTKAFRTFEKAEDPIASRHIVAITAYSINANKSKCINAGMDAFMAKPFEEAELVETLELFTDTPPLFTPVQKTITFIDPNKDPVTQTDHSQLNIEPIISLSNKDPNKTISQIELIIDQLKEKLQELGFAINGDDHQQIHRLSHQSLSLIKMFNYTPLSSIMSIISNTSKRGEMETSRALLYDLKKETFNAITLLHKEIASLEKKLV